MSKTFPHHSDAEIMECAQNATEGEALGGDSRAGTRLGTVRGSATLEGSGSSIPRR